MCETLMLGVMAPEAHQNDRGYVRELSGLTFDSLCKKLAWWAAYMHGAPPQKKKHCTVKIGVLALARGWALARGQYGK